MSAYSDAVLGDSPKAYYPLTEAGESVGAVYADATGHGYDVQVQTGKLTHTTGPLPCTTAPLFPDFSVDPFTNADALLCATTAGLPVDLEPYSLEGWLLPQLPGHSMQWVAYGLPNGPVCIGADIDIEPDDVDHLHLSNYQAANVARNSYPIDAGDGHWHYIVITDDGAGTVMFYVDGVAVQTFSVDAHNGLLYAADNVLSIGDAGGGYGNQSPAADPYCGGIAQVALYDRVLPDAQVAAHYAAALASECPPDWVRVSHSGGQGYWQSRGDVTEEWAGGAVRVRLPFPTAGAPPADVLGKDTATGLPVWASIAAIAPPDTGQQPLPAATVYQTVPVVPAPPPPDPVVDHCPQITCGAAVQLAHKLRTQYDLIRGLLIFMLSLPGLLRLGAASGAPAGKTVIVWVVEQMIKWLIKQEAEKWVIAVFYAVLGALSVPGLSFVNSDAEDIGDAGEAQLAVLAYPVLTCSANVFQLTPAMVANWGARILLDTTDFSEWQRHLLVYCIQATPFWTYDQTAASGAASPSDACAGWTGP